MMLYHEQDQVAWSLTSHRRVQDTAIVFFKHLGSQFIKSMYIFLLKNIMNTAKHDH